MDDKAIRYVVRKGMSNHYMNYLVGYSVGKDTKYIYVCLYIITKVSEFFMPYFKQLHYNWLILVFQLLIIVTAGKGVSRMII